MSNYGLKFDTTIDMKKIIYISVLLLSFFLSNAQKHSINNDFRFGFGAIQISNNSHIGGTFYNSYNFNLHKNFSIEPTFNFSYAEKTETTDFSGAMYMNADVNMYYIPFPFYPILRFKLGFGASCLYFNNFAGVDNETYTITKGLTYGSVFVVAYDIPISRDIIIGLKLRHNRFDNKETNTAASFNIGVRF